MKDWITQLIIFLILNFGALAVGAFFTGKGVPSDWYQQLNKAPWTPPGWVFGVVWGTIMIFLAIFMTKATINGYNQTIVWIYAIQLILNVIWNPIFFHYHQMGFGLIIISTLTLVVFSMMLLSWSNGNYLFLTPYLIWLIIATSLNYYAWAYN